MKHFFCILVLLVIGEVTSDQIGLQRELTSCIRNSNRINNCLAQLLENIRPSLTKGIPELNIPVLEPIVLNNLEFVQKEGAIKIVARFGDVLAYGFSNFTLEDIQFDIKNLVLRVQVYIPFLDVTGTYRLDGNLILFPIAGNGGFTAFLDDIHARMISQIVMKDEGGKKRLGIENTRVNFTLGNAYTELDNLFNGDKILGETVNHFINNNDQLILEEINPVVSRDIGLLIQNVMDSAVSTFPVSLLQP